MFSERTIIYRFSLIGLLNTAIGFTVILAFLKIGSGDVLANAAGYAAGLGSGYALNRRWTFGIRRSLDLEEVQRYIIAFSIAWICNIILVTAGVHAELAGSPLLHLVGAGIYSAIFYVLSRHFVFVEGKSRNVALPRFYLGDTIVIPLTIAIILILHAVPLTHDVVWQLWISRQEMNGVDLYRQINEVNPPLWFWMAAPVQLLAKFAGLPAREVLIGLICLMGLLSSLLVGRLGTFVGEPERALAMVSTLITGLCISIYDFGQREQLALVGAIPYAFLIAARMRQEQPKLLVTLLTATLASFGFALKHYFILVPIALEILLIVRVRHDYRPIRTETVVLAMLAIAYGAAIAIASPSYLTDILPMVQQAYFGYESPVWMWFDEPAQVFWCLAIAVIIFANIHRLPSDRAETPALMISAGSFFLAYLLQGKGWQYHAIPVSGMLAMAVASLGFAKGQRIDDLRQSLLALTVIALFVSLMVDFFVYRNPKELVAARIVRTVPRDAPVLFIHSNPMWGWPAVENEGRRWASRYFAHWMIPAIAAARAERHNGLGMQVLEQQIRDETTEDLICAAPPLIIIENGESGYTIRPKNFDTLAFFRESDAFRTYFDAYYHESSGPGWLRVFRRNNDTPALARPECRQIF